MGLKFRLIARLDVRNEHLISRIRFEGVRKIGDPADFAEQYDTASVDELLFLDAVASLYGRSGLAAIIHRTADRSYCPISVGGGVGGVADCRPLFLAGADKVAINTGAVQRPELITEIAHKYGSQAVVLQLDAKRKNGGWEAYCDGGRQATGRCALDWANEAVDRGAGEVLVTSIDREGTRTGLDVELLGEIAPLPVPVICSGGFGAPHHAVEAYEAGASGVAVASALHYGKTTINEIRQALSEAGIAVRKAA